LRGAAVGDRGLSGGNGPALACDGDSRAMLGEGDTVALPDDGDSVALPDDGDHGRAAGLAAGDAPPGRLPAPARCAGGSTEIPAQPAASAAEVTIPASNDRSTCSQSPDWGDVPDFPPR